MSLGFYRYRRGYGAFKSPPVLQDHGYCYLTFYYMLDHIGHASLTVFTEDNIGKKLSTLWNAEVSTNNWKKKSAGTSNIVQLFRGFSGVL